MMAGAIFESDVTGLLIVHLDDESYEWEETVKLSIYEHWVTVVGKQRHMFNRSEVKEIQFDK